MNKEAERKGKIGRKKRRIKNSRREIVCAGMEWKGKEGEGEGSKREGWSACPNNGGREGGREMAKIKVKWNREGRAKTEEDTLSKWANKGERERGRETEKKEEGKELEKRRWRRN